MAFFAKVSDPRIGGTYMTLLNTLANLGNQWNSSPGLYLLDKIDVKTCELPNGLQSDCKGSILYENCIKNNGKCILKRDGYTILSYGCFLIGLVWYKMMKKPIENLQSTNEESWRCKTAKST